MSEQETEKLKTVTFQLYFSVIIRSSYLQKLNKLYIQVRLKKLEYYEKIGYLSWGIVEAQNFNCISLTGPKLIYPQLYVGIIEQLWFPPNDH